MHGKLVKAKFILLKVLKRVTHRSAVDAGNPHTGVFRIAARGLTKLK
jgi:hypothetical protein